MTMGEESKLLTSLPSITLPTLDLTTIIVVLAIQIAFFVGRLKLIILQRNGIKSSSDLGLIARDHIGIFFPQRVAIEPYFKDGYTSYYGQRVSDYEDFSNSGLVKGYEDYEYPGTSYPYQTFYSKNEEYVYS